MKVNEKPNPSIFFAWAALLELNDHRNLAIWKKQIFKICLNWAIFSMENPWTGRNHIFQVQIWRNLTIFLKNAPRVQTPHLFPTLFGFLLSRLEGFNSTPPTFKF